MVSQPNYELGLHIGSLFIIMGFSFLGTVMPVVAKKYKFLSSKEILFQCAKMFGTGVILATALVHMLSPSDQALTNPCLPTIFTEDYTSFSGAFCLLGILTVHLVQFLVSYHLKTKGKHTALPSGTVPEDTPIVPKVLLLFISTI